jgi:hypothetical protein
VLLSGYPTLLSRASKNCAAPCASTSLQQREAARHLQQKSAFLKNTQQLDVRCHREVGLHAQSWGKKVGASGEMTSSLLIDLHHRVCVRWPRNRSPALVQVKSGVSDPSSAESWAATGCLWTSLGLCVRHLRCTSQAGVRRLKERKSDLSPNHTRGHCFPPLWSLAQFKD